MILKQARELGMIPKINFMGSDEMAEQEMVNLAGAKACEGTYSLATYGSVPAEFTKRVKDKFNAPMHYAILFGYDGVMALTKAIEIAQSLEGPKIRDGLLKVDFKGLQGPIKFETFDGFKNQGRYSPYIIRWVNGNRQVVEVK